MINMESVFKSKEMFRNALKTLFKKNSLSTKCRLKELNSKKLKRRRRPKMLVRKEMIKNELVNTATYN
jgi:hypothetical protein